jgi:pimeloyl-ACP methyl ester carboxylesterase
MSDCSGLLHSIREDGGFSRSVISHAPYRDQPCHRARIEIASIGRLTNLGENGMRRPRGRWWLALCCALGLAFSGPASAGRILVLVHGYLGDSASWQQSGALPVLAEAGWKLAGNWQSTPSGVWLDPVGPPAGEFAIYTVDLPSTAPLMEQARLLGGMLSATAQRHPKDTVDLIGHSAGGVVARLALVNYGAGTVTRLITIAAPHLGTERASEALDATDDSGLFGGIKRWFVKRKVGDDLYRTLQSSRGVLADLAPPVPGNLLYWLNGRQHPDILYVAVVRGAAYGLPGDQVVPAPSQDLRRVPALNGRAGIRVVAGGHELSPQDGLLLSELVSKPAHATATGSR